MECYEKGLINKADTGGLELTFGNAEAMVEMTKKIALREDIGNLLAEGVKRASEKIGQGSEHFAMHIKGVEMTGYEIRGLKTCALGYAVSRREQIIKGMAATAGISVVKLTGSRLTRVGVSW